MSTCIFMQAQTWRQHVGVVLNISSVCLPVPSWFYHLAESTQLNSHSRPKAHTRLAWLYCTCVCVFIHTPSVCSGGHVQTTTKSRTICRMKTENNPQSRNTIKPTRSVYLRYLLAASKSFFLCFVCEEFPHGPTRSRHRFAQTESLVLAFLR